MLHTKFHRSRPVGSGIEAVEGSDDMMLHAKFQDHRTSDSGEDF